MNRNSTDSDLKTNTSPSIASPATDSTISLSDGRILGYAEYGPSNGDPLIFCHGTPGSRYTRHPNGSLLEKYDIRQITLERPGYGRSTHQPNRELLDWPQDVQEAADALGIDQFAIAGFSGGGPHALVCAAQLPQRVTHATIINGIGPLRAPGATDGMEWKNRLGLRLAGLPFIPQLMAWPIVRKIRKDIEGAIDAVGERFADADEKVLQREEVRAMFQQDFPEAVSQGTKGYARDARIFSQPWGFELSEISVPVDLWHGELDTNVPLAMAQFMAEEIPSCTDHFYPNDGHLLMFEYGDEIMSSSV